MKVHEFSDGLAILGDACDQAVLAVVQALGPVALIVADPPYGEIVNEPWDKVLHIMPTLRRDVAPDEAFVSWMLGWTEAWAPILLPQAAFYVWGGIGRPGFRPFYLYLREVEREGQLLLANHVTWKKKRAYGIQHNYLFTREELAYLISGTDITKPRRFHVPYLSEKRGYAGYDPDHPAKSEFLRRSNVWDETEILRGKLHRCQKADRVSEIPIEVHTDPGEMVVDLFAGSGSTAAAARRLKRRWVAVENDPAAFETLCARMR